MGISCGFRYMGIGPDTPCARFWYRFVVGLKKMVCRCIPVSSNGAFVVDLPHRKSFCADASYYVGPNSGMKFFDGAPRFAVEMRAEKDYGPDVDEARAAKRQDYFDSETRVIWDVDLLAEEDIVRVYRNNNADVPAAIYKRGEIAEAEPAVPGWTMPVNDLFE